MMELDRIYLGDCLKLMRDIPDGYVDLCLTDPPYEISRQSNFSSGEETGRDVDRFRISVDFGEWDACGAFDIEQMCKECYRVLKDGGYFICFYDIWKISELYNICVECGFKQLRFIEWIKTNPVPINSKINYLTNAREVAVCAVKGGNSVFKSEYDNGVYSFPICHEKERFHPTQKNLDLIRSLIIKHSNEDDIVLDCCSGSGTTAVAAWREKRHFICFEKDPVYWEKSVERVKKEQANLTLF